MTNKTKIAARFVTAGLVTAVLATIPLAAQAIHATNQASAGAASLSASVVSSVVSSAAPPGILFFPRWPAVTPGAEPSGIRWQKQWKISLAPLVASQAVDAASSYGLRETNPVLAGSNGGFGMKAAGVKFGVIGALIVGEVLLVKKYPRSAKFLALVNWTTSGATAGLAVHNYMLPGR